MTASSGHRFRFCATPPHEDMEAFALFPALFELFALRARPRENGSHPMGPLGPRTYGSVPWYAARVLSQLELSPYYAEGGVGHVRNTQGLHQL